ncbi:MAG: DUF3426 domain-containing protein, partial [Pseudomonadales bacterium]
VAAMSTGGGSTTTEEAAAATADAAAASSPLAAPSVAATPVAAEPVAAEAAPVVFGEPRARRPLVWAGIAFGLLLLAVQVLWYQFDDWAKQPQWRGLYATACRTLGCELPVQRDVALLATRNLAVRSDPQQRGMLLVNAVIVNDAEFAQPFPVLELRFTSLRDILVAGRRYHPEEYLSGDAMGMTLIPAKTPVQVELSIEDPGPEAVNYFLRLR